MVINSRKRFYCKGEKSLIFKYTEYKRFLKYTRSIAPIFSFSSWKNGPGVILRHDIDLSLESSLLLAQAEAELKVEATYFILVTSPLYNCLSSSGQNRIREIQSLGFEIGLHFDLSLYQNPFLELEKEVGILSNIIRRSVRSISLHNPSVTGRYPIFDGYINAYDKKFFSPDAYLSDSRMIFRQSPYEFVKQAPCKLIQLALHPFHFTETGESYLGITRRLVLDFVDCADGILKVNSTYQDVAGKKKILDSLKKNAA